MGGQQSSKHSNRGLEQRNIDIEIERLQLEIEEVHNPPELGDVSEHD